MKLMKQSLCVLFIILFAGTGWGFELTPANVTGNPGESVKVPVNISNVTDVFPLDAFSFIVQYDSSVLTFEKAEKTGITGDFNLLKGGIPENGRVKVNGVKFDEFPVSVNSDGLFINLYFTINSNANKNSDLSLSDFKDDIKSATTKTGLVTVNSDPDVDSDGDGMPDSWEIANGLNPNDDKDAILDADKDGVSNLDEFLNQTNPTVDDYFFIAGTITYTGDQTGTLYVNAFTASDTEFKDPASGTVEVWNDSTESMTYTFKVPNGVYTLKAFIDTNENETLDADEAQGEYDSDITVSDGDDTESRDFALEEEGTEDGLVAYYPFDEDFKDHSGQERHAEMVGTPERVADRCDDKKALQTGEGSYLRVPAEKGFVPGAESFTIALWFRTDSLEDIPASRLLSLQKGDFSDGAAIWVRTKEKGYPYIRLMMDDSEGESAFQYLNSPEIELAKWTHTAAVISHEQNTVTLYVDGIAVDSQPLAMGSIDPTRDMLIGAYDYGDRITSDAIQIDELRIYSRALSEGEVQKLAQPCNSQAENKVTVELSETNVKTDTTFKTSIHVNGKDIWATDAKLILDPAVFTNRYKGRLDNFITKGSNLVIGPLYDENTGVWHAATTLKNPNDPVAGEGYLATEIGFRAVGDVYGKKEIKCEVILTDKWGNTLPTETVSGFITIDDGLHVEGGTVITGTVVLPDGKPVEGVEVTIKVGGKEETVITGKDGSYRFEDLRGLEDGEKFTIEASKDDFHAETEVTSVDQNPLPLPPLEILNTLLADLDGNGKVTITDFTILAGSYGTQTGDADFDVRADIKKDGKIDIKDLALFGSHWKLP